MVLGRDLADLLKLFKCQLTVTTERRDSALLGNDPLWSKVRSHELKHFFGVVPSFLVRKNIQQPARGVLIGWRQVHRLGEIFSGFVQFVFCQVGVAKVTPRDRILRLDAHHLLSGFDVTFHIFLEAIPLAQLLPCPKVVRIDFGDPPHFRNRNIEVASFTFDPRGAGC